MSNFWGCFVKEKYLFRTHLEWQPKFCFDEVGGSKVQAWLEVSKMRRSIFGGRCFGEILVVVPLGLRLAGANKSDLAMSESGLSSPFCWRPLPRERERWRRGGGGEGGRDETKEEHMTCTGGGEKGGGKKGGR